jgi:hypothetical protein
MSTIIDMEWPFVAIIEWIYNWMVSLLLTDTTADSTNGSIDIYMLYLVM